MLSIHLFLFLFFMEPPLKIIAVKSSIAGIGRKPQYISLLKTLVVNAHTLVLHTFSFLKYIFIHELENNSTFPLEDFINVEFFKEVFLSHLSNYKPDKQKALTKLRAYKGPVLNYRHQYFQCCSYEPVNMKHVNQIGSYEVVKIVTAYLNGSSFNSETKFECFLTCS